jgi:AcrR family transcriptional regulator
MKDYLPTEETVLAMIELLENEGSFSPIKVASELGISLGNLNKHYRHLLPQKNTNTNHDKIINTIKLLQAQTGETKFRITQIAREAQISRSSIYEDYPDLIDYIKGKKSVVKDFPDSESISDQMQLESKIRQLKQQLIEKDKQTQAIIEKERNQTFSTLMKSDLNNFSVITDEAELHKLRIQSRELISQNKELIRKQSNLEFELAELKTNTTILGTSAKVAHLSADYSLLLKASEQAYPLKELKKLLVETEDDLLQRAITHIQLTKPSLVIFFQPFFSCKFEQFPFVPRDGNIVIVETNFISPVKRKSFIDLLEFPCIYIAADSSTSRAKLFLKSTRLGISQELVEDIYEHRQFAGSDEKFDGNMIFNPRKLTRID